MLKISVLVLGFSTASSYNYKEIPRWLNYAELWSMQVVAVKVVALNLWQIFLLKLCEVQSDGGEICILNSLLLCLASLASSSRERLRSWVFICWFFDVEKASFADLNLSSPSMFKVTSNWKNLTVKGKEDLKYSLLSMLLACKQTGSNNQGCCYLGSWQSFTRSSVFGYINVHYWDLSFTRYSHKCL